jgi:hypothetical protein
MNLIVLSPPKNTLEQGTCIKENGEVRDGSNSVTKFKMGASASSSTSMNNRKKHQATSRSHHCHLSRSWTSNWQAAHKTIMLTIRAVCQIVQDVPSKESIMCRTSCSSEPTREQYQIGCWSFVPGSDLNLINSRGAKKGDVSISWETTLTTWCNSLMGSCWTPPPRVFW